MDTAEDANATASPAVVPEKETAKLFIADIVERVGFLGKALAQRELRYAVRAVRNYNGLKKVLTREIITSAITSTLPAEEGERLCEFVGGCSVDMDAGSDGNGSEEGSAESGASPTSTEVTADAVPTASAFLQVLLAGMLAKDGDLDTAKTVLVDLVTRVEGIERREASPVLSKVYFQYARVFELLGSPAEAKSALNKALRTQTLQKNTLSQAVIVNCLLRIYFLTNLIDQAEMLLSRVDFPENAPTAEMARYMYYLGYCKAVQLEYTDAHHYLLQATRKAPQSAEGFLQQAHKALVVVQMLLGEIPERSLFKTPYLTKPLDPYFHLAQAVRNGEVHVFTSVVEEHKARFVADKTFNLVLRLRQSVIKAGVRTICLSYSRISLADMAAKLGLDSAEDAEFVVAKAVRDGVVDATIDHQNKWVTSKDVVDVYSTTGPQEAFHRRIAFCMKLHQDALKSMRYPPDLHRIKHQTADTTDDDLAEKDLESLSDLEDEDFLDE